MWFPILLVIAGIVLKANPLWFAGAATVGGFCFWIGVVWLVLVVIFWIIALLAVGASASTPTRRYRRRRRRR